MATGQWTNVNKKSAVSEKAPLVSDLLYGEIAVNTYDGDLYIKKNDGVEQVVKIASDDTTKQPKENGFEDRTKSDLTFTDGNRQFTITPNDTSYVVYSNSIKFVKNAAESIIIPDTEGIHYIYFDISGVLTTTQVWSDDIVTLDAQVASVHWDAANNIHISLSEERHGTVMDSETQLYERSTSGAKYASGMLVADVTSDGNGDNAVDAQMSVGSGVFWNQDLELLLDAEALASTNIDHYYRTGANGDWRAEAGNGYISTTDGNRAVYNEWTGTTWQRTEVKNNDFVLMHLVATNELDGSGYIWIMGQEEYPTAGSARDAILYEILNIDLSGIDSNEMKAVASFIIQTSNGYDNDVQSRVRPTDGGGDYYDWRLVNVGVVASIGGITTQALGDLTDVIITNPLTTDLLRFNGTEWINDVQSTDFANAVHTHVETDITDLDRIRWKGAWAPIDYFKNDQVVDNKWTMIANKNTADRAAPQPNGDPLWAYSDTPPFTTGTNTSVVRSGSTYTFTEGLWIQQLRIWVPETGTDINYRVVILDTTTPTNPIARVINDPVVTAGAWTTIAADNLIVNTGSVMSVYIDATNSASNTTIVGDWTYDGTSNNSGPNNQGWNRRNQSNIIRFDYNDLTGTDREAELLAIPPGSTVKIYQETNPQNFDEYYINSTAVDSGLFCEFDVTLIARPNSIANGTTCNATFTIPVAEPTAYSTATGYWLTNQPSYATVQGVLEYDGVPQSSQEDNGFGVDFKVQPAYVSEDWDYVAGAAFSATSGSGGTSSPLTTKGDLYTYDTNNQRLPVGTNDYVLTADSSEATGIKWAPGGGSFVEMGGYTDLITSTATIDASVYNSYIHTLTSNTTIVFTNVPDGEYTCDLTITGNGSATLTWPNGISWVGIQPISPPGTDILLVSLSSSDNGTSWVGVNSEIIHPEELVFSGDTKVQTTNTGATVTGILEADDITTGQLHVDGNNTLLDKCTMIAGGTVTGGTTPVLTDSFGVVAVVRNGVGLFTITTNETWVDSAAGKAAILPQATGWLYGGTLVSTNAIMQFTNSVDFHFANIAGGSTVPADPTVWSFAIFRQR